MRSVSLPLGVLLAATLACGDASDPATGTDPGSSTATSSGAPPATTEADTSGPDGSSSSGGATPTCTLPGASTRHHMVGTMTIDGVEKPDEALATGALDPLVGQTIEFCATFEPGDPIDTPEAQRVFTISSIALETGGSDGVLGGLLANPTDGTMFLRLPSLSPFRFIAVIGAELEKGFINWEFICEEPEPFALDASGLPTLQSFRCDGGTVVLRRFAGASAVTDAGFGSAVFATNVP